MPEALPLLSEAGNGSDTGGSVCLSGTESASPREIPLSWGSVPSRLGEARVNERVLGWMRVSKDEFVPGGFRGLLGAAWPALLTCAGAAGPPGPAVT